MEVDKEYSKADEGTCFNGREKGGSFERRSYPLEIDNSSTQDGGKCESYYPSLPDRGSRNLSPCAFGWLKLLFLLAVILIILIGFFYLIRYFIGIIT